MPNYILVSLLFLAWTFFELSGGRDFDPDAAVQARMAERKLDDQILSLRIAAAPPARLSDPRSETEAETIPTTVRLEPITIPAGSATAAKQAPTPDIATPETTATPEPAATDPAPEAPETPEVMVQDMRVVRPARANMRSGPGTNYEVLATLDRGSEVELLGDPTRGWVQLRVIETNLIGWMAQSLLRAPSN